MKNLAIKYWYLAAIALSVVLGLNFSDWAEFIKEYNLLKIGIFLSFFLTSLTLEAGAILSESKNFKAIIAALVSGFVFFPLIAKLFAQIMFNSNADFLVGFCILAVAPVTLATATVLTTLAGGNVPLNLIINITTNTLAIFTIPISLKILLSGTHNIELPTLEIMVKIFVMVILPVILGQLIRIKIKEKVMRARKAFSQFCKFVILVLIFNAIANSAEQLGQLGYRIIFVIVAAIILHIVILAMNFGISRLLSLDAASTSAFTITTSQKTIGLSFIIWISFFAKDFPLAMIPTICYHLTQSMGDTYLVHYLNRKKQEP